MAKYVRLSLTPSTKPAYNQAARRYNEFCTLCRWTPLPASDCKLAAFAAHLAQAIRPVTVSNYISAVRNLHLESGYPDPIANAILLPRVVRGIKRAMGVNPVLVRLPLTSSLIRKLVDSLRANASLCSQDQRMMQAACLLAFHGFLRCSEFLADSDIQSPATHDCVQY